MKQIRLISLTSIVSIFFFMGILAFTHGAFAANSQAGVTVLVDGLPVSFDVEPLIRDGRTLVPFRAIAEALNVTVVWDGKTNSIAAAAGTNLIKIKINSSQGYINDASVTLDVPPQIIKNRTLVPLRFFSENLGFNVEWDPQRQEIRINTPGGPGPMRLIGYYALGDSKTSSWRDLFGADYPASGTGHTNLVSDAALGWFSLDPEGNLLTASKTGWQRPDGWPDVLRSCQEYQVKATMVVHMTDKDGELSRLLQAPEAVRKAVENICTEAENFAGVNLDLEGLGWNESGAQLQQTRDDFTGFVRLLSAQLKEEPDKELSLSLHALNSAYPGYDYQALGPMCDYLIIMAYDYGDTPEPLNRVSEAIELALAEVPASKLVLGVSVPNENPDSLKEKMALAKRFKLQGIALWRLGLVSDEMWLEISKTLAKASVSP